MCPPRPLSTSEQTELDGHLAAIDQNGLGHVRIVAPHLHPAVFNAGVTVIDAPALAWTGRKNSGSDRWDKFVREFVDDTYVGLYEHLRNPGLHNLSASAHIVLVSGATDRRLHRQVQAGMLHLHTEEFAKDVEGGFVKFSERLREDPDAARRALTQFRANPPVRWSPWYGGAAESASATSGTTGLRPAQGSPTPSPRPAPRMAIPKTRKPPKR